MKEKLKYISLFLFKILIGLLSRKIANIPAIAGDALYAVMSYWMFRCLFTSKSKRLALLLSILFCFSIEFLQLIQIQPLIWGRNHSFVRLILGQGFLWLDLVAYSIGSLTAYFMDEKLLKHKL